MATKSLPSNKNYIYFLCIHGVNHISCAVSCQVEDQFLYRNVHFMQSSSHYAHHLSECLNCLVLKKTLMIKKMIKTVFVFLFHILDLWLSPCLCSWWSYICVASLALLLLRRCTKKRNVNRPDCPLVYWPFCSWWKVFLFLSGSYGLTLDPDSNTTCRFG